VIGTLTSVKEQMLQFYAEEMVERWFCRLRLRFPRWGKSGDLPQNTCFFESPHAKTSGIRAALEIISTLPKVDVRQINGLGICASAGYMIDAAAGNDGLGRIGLIARWLQSEEIVNAVYGGAEGVAALIEIGRADEAAGGQIYSRRRPHGGGGGIHSHGRLLLRGGSRMGPGT